jgi:adenylate cyclase
VYSALSRRRRAALLLVVAAVAAGVGVLAYETHLLRRPEFQTIDARFDIRGSEPHRTAGLVVVGIDDQTFNYFRNRKLPAQWPFPRRYHARVIEQLHRAGAKVIALDLQFTEESDEADDNALIEAVAKAGDVVLATTEVLPGGRTNVLGGDEVLHSIGGRAANTTLVPDSDGVLRRMQYSLGGLKTFGVVAAEVASGHAIAPARFGGAHHPVPIDYAGPPGAVREVSYSEVYAGRVPARALAGKIVIVGATAPTLHDSHQASTSGSEQMAGAEVLANATATALDGVPLRDAAGWVNIVLIVLLGCVAPIASIRIAPLWSLLASLVVGIAVAISIQLAFNGGTIIAFTYPLGALVLAALGTLAVTYLSEAFERQRVRTMFARFVPSGVVDEVLDCTDDNLRLGALERDCTVLFSDLRGFTSFSETQPVERVIEVVNFYIGEMTEAILETGGTLISYMGDGIMALFGAPLEQPDHADRALAAAREMLGPRLRRFNEWLAENGHGHAFHMGIGLNSGPVMAGNVGSDLRLEYTAIGDTTNTASRLESMTKQSGYELLLAESTFSRLTDSRDELTFVDELEIRGRERKVRVWSLASARTRA